MSFCGVLGRVGGSRPQAYSAGLHLCPEAVEFVMVPGVLQDEYRVPAHAPLFKASVAPNGRDAAAISDCSEYLRVLRRSIG